jgi:16S rRNA (uracil1498-N3)-methyltransferase
MAKIRRAYHPDVKGSGSLLDLDPEESHHVARVLRLRRGDALSVFDGCGREWDGEIDAIDVRVVRIRVGCERSCPVEPALQVTLFQALCRPERMEWVIQKGTEVGASAFRPVRTERVETRDPSAERLDRWRRIAIEACKQSGRRAIPEIGPVSGLPETAPPETLALLLDGGPESPPAGRYLSGPQPGSVWIAVGPEGGLTRDEISNCCEGGWKPAGLGPRTLRTETAGVVACSLVLHAWDDLGTERTGRI